MTKEVLFYIGVGIVFLLIIGIIITIILFMKMNKSIKQSITKQDNFGVQMIRDLVEMKQNIVKQDKSESVLLKQQEAATSLEMLNKNILNGYKNISNALMTMQTTDMSSQKVLDNMNSRINAMNDIMVNKKSRGNWGEYQLNNLLSIYTGNNQEVYKVQYTLQNGFIGDVALKLPNTDKVMIIDSKFPLENYKNLLDEELSELEYKKYINLFIQNIKKHINDISSKYITEETVPQAIMFIPSEAIYTFICGEIPELIEYAHSQHVLLTSPTTLIGVAFTLVNVTKDWHRNKNLKKIEKNIVMMVDDARRLNERLEKCQNNLQSLQKSLNDTTISSNKIVNRIENMADGYIEEE